MTLAMFLLDREEIRSPKILYNRKALRHVLQGWIPVLHSALESCNETSSQSPTLCLKNWLQETADVCTLTQMCLDTGVYGETEAKSRGQKKCARDSPAREGKEVEEKSHDQQEHEVKTEIESSSCRGESTTDVMSRDQEICSRDDLTLQSDNPSDARESPRDLDHPHDNVDVIANDGEQTRDDHVNMESSGEASHEQNEKQENSNDVSLSNYEDKSHTEWTCDSCTRNRDVFIKHIFITCRSHSTNEAGVELKRDWERACFIRRYFDLLRVKDIRRTLGMTRGSKVASWSALLRCIGGWFVRILLTYITYIGEIRFTRVLCAVIEHADIATLSSLE